MAAMLVFVWEILACLRLLAQESQRVSRVNTPDDELAPGEERHDMSRLREGEPVTKGRS